MLLTTELIKMSIREILCSGVWKICLKPEIIECTYRKLSRYIFAFKNGKCYENQTLQLLNIFVFEKFLKNFMFLPVIILEIFTISQFDISDSQ